MAASSSDAILPLATTLILLVLAGALARRSAALGGMATDWGLAFLFGANAFAAVAAGVLVNWSEGGEAALVGGAVAACLAFTLIFARLLQRFTRGWFGSEPFRWLLLGGATAAAALGWGALAGGRALAGDGRVGPWVQAPVVLAILLLVLTGLLATRRVLARASQSGPFMLFGGLLLFSAGLLTATLGDAITGSALGMAGGGLLFVGAPPSIALAPSRAPPLVRPRVETGSGSRSAPGVKVRIPKGDAVRVSTFYDETESADERK